MLRDLSSRHTASGGTTALPKNDAIIENQTTRMAIVKHPFAFASQIVGLQSELRCAFSFRHFAVGLFANLETATGDGRSVHWWSGTAPPTTLFSVEHGTNCPCLK